MRKIISILIALGMILGLSVMAVPTAAQVAWGECASNTTLSNNCAGATGVCYNISFTAPVTLIPGNDRLSVKFGGNTSLAAVNASHVSLNGTNPTSITKNATFLDFPVPGTSIIPVGTPLWIQVCNVVNPAAGTYNLTLDYKQICCPAVDFCWKTYTIRPTTASYSCLLDFNDTYPGIALDFVPPFKACGQNSSGQDFVTWYNGTAWFNPFDFIVNLVTAGCGVPCTNASLFVRMTAAVPATVRATFNITGTFHTLNATNNITLPDAFVLNATGNSSLQMALHFDTPGSYKIYFKVYCPGGTNWTGTCPDCIPPGAETLVCEKTYDFTVYQWKDAAKLTLNEKWNLISLPLVPLVSQSVNATLASIPPAARANIESFWHYDRCTDKWFVWPTPGPTQAALTALEAGKAYWVRVKYPLAGCGNITWWVWGTEKPMPPTAPAEYKVCKGWNMFGFLSDANMPVQNYLWNWSPLPVVYGWGGGPCWPTQNWQLIPSGSNLTVGQGYWGAFPADGAIYVP